MDTIFRQPGKTGIDIKAEYSAGLKMAIVAMVVVMKGKGK